MNRRFRKLLLAATLSPLLVVASGHASAQRLGGNPEGVTGGIQDFQPDRDTRQSYQAYVQMLNNARCSANIGNRLVSTLLAQSPNSTTERLQLDQLKVRLPSCRATGLSNIASLMRGTLAEGMYLKGNVQPASLIGNAAAYGRFIEEQRVFNELRFAEDRSLLDASLCLIGRRPDLADAVLRTTHGSAQEGAAMDALFAGEASCAGPVRPARISRSYLRAFLADSLYRLTVFASAKTSQRQ